MLPSLSGNKIAFDINIDDGRELFGPQTGNSFGELSEYYADNQNNTQGVLQQTGFFLRENGKARYTACRFCNLIE